MLAEDILIDMCQYFNRKFMECALKLVGRKFLMIILRFPKEPYLIVPRVTLNVRDSRLLFVMREAQLSQSNTRKLFCDAPHRIVRDFSAGQFVRLWRARLPDYLRVICVQIWSYSDLLTESEKFAQFHSASAIGVLQILQKTWAQFPYAKISIRLRDEYISLIEALLLDGLANAPSIALNWTKRLKERVNVFDCAVVLDCAHLKLAFALDFLSEIEAYQIAEWLHGAPKIRFQRRADKGKMRVTRRRQLVTSCHNFHSRFAFAKFKRQIIAALLEVFKMDTTPRTFFLCMKNGTKTSEEGEIALLNARTRETFFVADGSDLVIKRHKTISKEFH